MLGNCVTGSLRRVRLTFGGERGDIAHGHVAVRQDGQRDYSRPETHTQKLRKNTTGVRGLGLPSCYSRPLAIARKSRSEPEDTAMDTEIKKWVEQYHRQLGWNLHPAIGKKPVGRWKRSQLERPQWGEVSQMFDRVPGANIALVLGPTSGGLMAIDPDRPQAEEYLQARGLPPTVSFRSTRGIKRLYRLRPEHYDLAHTRTPISKLEFRWNVVVIIPPSIRPEDKTLYEWLPGMSPFEMEIAFAPEWVVEIMTTGPRPPGPAHRERPHTLVVHTGVGNRTIQTLLKGVVDGERHAAATRIAGYFARKDVHAEIIWEILCLWDRENRPPMFDNLERIKEVRSIVDYMTHLEAMKRQQYLRHRATDEEGYKGVPT